MSKAIRSHEQGGSGTSRWETVAAAHRDLEARRNTGSSVLLPEPS